MTLTTAGEADVWVHPSPSNDVLPARGPRYAVPVDDAEPRTVNVTTATGADDTHMNRRWARNTSDNVNRTVTRHTIGRPGVHVLKPWMVDPTVIVHRIVVDTGGLRPGYPGPPESRRAGR